MTDILSHRVDRLERDGTALSREIKLLAESQRKLAESQIQMAAEIKVLIKEQTKLTVVLHSIAEFQADVKHMHSTQQRLFTRLERLESNSSQIRDEFHTYMARQEGKSSVIQWLVRNWHFLAVIGSLLAWGAWKVANPDQTGGG